MQTAKTKKPIGLFSITDPSRSRLTLFTVRLVRHLLRPAAQEGEIGSESKGHDRDKGDACPQRAHGEVEEKRRYPHTPADAQILDAIGAILGERGSHGVGVEQATLDALLDAIKRWEENKRVVNELIKGHLLHNRELAGAISQPVS